MSELKATPGPWFINPEPTLEGLAKIEDERRHGMFPIECEWTEAYFVAAAPDLYDECECASRVYQHLMEALEWLENNGGAPGAWIQNQREVLQARIKCNERVMAKARGE